MLCLLSALSKIATRFVNDCCLLVSRTLPVSLSLQRTLVGGRRFQTKLDIGTLDRRAGSLVHIEFCVKKLHLGTVSVSHMVSASAAISLLC